ncbi:DNA binding domain-containing protein, excisionase family [Brevibacterium sp. Mu109]|uniref:helix-turn-helix domain-containing protein n=1 Tax=Brevibacterium sp. Mu109 TaxID=1255669 RepID=UPI000C5F03CF|nr:helix-turn-helix domain-containing protein [Brevibacterium sp. Mu109]SMX80714.1 DNA binding domain-containing protein, excisionase family [Brevibacterium sp. Mu109]
MSRQSTPLLAHSAQPESAPITVSTVTHDLTISETAQLTQTSDATVRRWIAEGKLRAYRYGQRAIRIDPADLRKFRQQVNPATFTKVSGGDAA